MSQERMLAGFASYREPVFVTRNQYVDQQTMATPPGCRLLRIIRLPHGWRLWTATHDFIYGTYLELFDDGRVLHCTTRRDEGDEYYWSRPSDNEIRSV